MSQPNAPHHVGPERSWARRWIRRNRLSLALLGVVATAALVVTGFTVPNPPGVTPASGAEVHRGGPVVFVAGDSLAGWLITPLRAGLGSLGMDVRDLTLTGGGLVEHPRQRAELLTQIHNTRPDFVVYGFGLADAGTPLAQQSALTELAQMSASVGAPLLFVQNPPLREVDGDSRTSPERLSQIAALAHISESLADQSAGMVQFLPAKPAWGSSFRIDANHDGIPDRARKGLALCPSGSALWGRYVATEFAARYVPGRTLGAVGWRSIVLTEPRSLGCR